MEQVRLGSSGLPVSRVCPGMMSYGSLRLSSEEVACVEEPHRPHPVLGHQ
jgi:aryl-alcohol dehydrogenase-like predicted oxidoreductase